VGNRYGFLRDYFCRAGYFHGLCIPAKLTLYGDNSRGQVTAGDGSCQEWHAASGPSLAGKSSALPELPAARSATRAALETTLPSLARLLCEYHGADDCCRCNGN